MAQVLGSAPKEAALQLAKALEAPDVGLTALQRSGTRFTEQQKAMVKELVASGKLLEAQDFILKEIEKQYGGAAKAAGSSGYAGALDTLGESFRDLQEKIGGSIEGPVSNAMKSLAGSDLISDNWNAISTTIANGLGLFRKFFQAIGDGFNQAGVPVADFGQTVMKVLAFIGILVKDFTNNVIILLADDW